MATRTEVLQLIDKHRQAGDEAKAVGLEKWLAEKEAPGLADQKRRASSNYGEDILRSIPGAFARGNEFISAPFTAIADKLSGGAYSESLGRGEEALFGDAAQYLPQTGPGRMASAGVEALSSATVPIGGQAAAAVRGLAPAVKPGLEAGLAGLAGLAGQSARETLPEQMPGRSIVATGLELATPMGAAQLARKVSLGKGLLPEGAKAKLPTAAGQQAAARKAFTDQFGNEQLLFNLDNASAVGGQKQTTALMSKNPELLAQQQQAVRSPDFDTKAIAQRESALKSKYFQILSDSDVHTIPQAQRHVLNDLANHLDASTPPGAARKYNHKVIKDFYQQNKADIDAVPELKKLFNQPNSLSLKAAIDSDLGDFSALSKMGLTKTLNEIDVWKGGNPFTQLEELSKLAKTPRQKLALKRQVHKAFTSRIFGDTRDVGNMDDEFIQKSYGKLVNIWDSPGGVEALRQVYNPDQMLVLHSVVDHMTRSTGLKGAAGISMPSSPNQALKDVAGLWTMNQLNRVYSSKPVQAIFGRKSMAGGLKIGSIGSRVANKKISEMTVGPFNAEYVRILDDGDYAAKVVRDALGDSTHKSLRDSAREALKGTKAPSLSVEPSSIGVGRFAPGLTPTGTFEYETP